MDALIRAGVPRERLVALVRAGDPDQRAGDDGRVLSGAAVIEIVAAPPFDG